MAPRGLFVFTGAYTGDGFADLATGIANATEQDYLQGIYPTRYWDLSEFVQDDFRLRSNLTLNLGVRYELFSPANGLAWSLPRNTVVRSAFGIFHSAESNIFDDLGLNPPQDTFNATQYSQGGNIIPSQLISSGFPDTFPAYDPANLFGSVKTTGAKRLIPRILEWNLTIQHQFAQNWVFQ